MNGNYNVGDTVLGKWKLEEELGAGSYGKVFRAVHEDFGETYESAIKIITVSVSKNEIDEAINEGQTLEQITAYYESFVGDIAGEFAIMSKLKGSSHIVGYEDHEVVPFTEGFGWDIIIRMELLTPLSAKLKNEGMTLNDVCRLGIDICRALELCRANSIIHRDIKSENIMVNSIGDYKLGDFGVARTMDKTMGGMSKKGTYTYMAPEVYKEEPYNHRADIYSLGLVLYRLLNNNRSPFLPPYPEKISPSDRETALARRFRGEALPAPVNATPELTAIIQKACAYRQEDRFDEPTTMRLALEAALAGDFGSIELNLGGSSEGSASVSSGSAVNGKKKKKRRPGLVLGIIAVVTVSAAVAVMVLVPQADYNKALDLYNAGSYEEAIAAFEAMGGYKDSAEQISACEAAIKERDYNAALELMNAGEYEQAIAAFKEMDGYSASADQIAACEAALREINYAAAVELMDAGNYAEALPVFAALDGYEDSSVKAAECQLYLLAAEAPALQAGSTVRFGFYEQDNDASNGREEIEWTVLSVENGRALVISKYGLESMPYNTGADDVTWETCSLRAWLNDGFLTAAFADAEQALIPAVKVPADKNPEYSFNPGKVTEDRVFILSIKEAERYFTDDASRRCAPTACAAAQGAYMSSGFKTAEGEDVCRWWLRTPGFSQRSAAGVFFDGSIRTAGDRAHGSNGCVRPAVWISLDLINE